MGKHPASLTEVKDRLCSTPKVRTQLAREGRGGEKRRRRERGGEGREWGGDRGEGMVG